MKWILAFLALFSLSTYTYTLDDYVAMGNVVFADGLVRTKPVTSDAPEIFKGDTNIHEVLEAWERIR